MLVKEYYVYVLYRWDYTPMYVGMGKNDRWLWHEINHGFIDKGNKHKAYSVNKTLRILGKVPKIKIRIGLTKNEAVAIEKMLIKAIGRYPNGPLVNRTDGGEGHSNPSAEARKKFSDIHRGKPMHPNAKKALVEYWTGRKPSVEKRAKISATLTGYKRSEEEIRKSAENRRGAQRSDEARQRMREAAIRRCQSESVREELSERGMLGAQARWGTTKS